MAAPDQKVVGIIAPNLHALLAGERSGYGGAELDVRHIAEALLARGWHCVLLTQTESPQPLREWHGMTIRTIPPRTPSHTATPSGRIARLWSDLRYLFRFTFALFHLPGGVWLTKLAGLQSLLALIVGRLRGIPVVFRFGHDRETDPRHLAQECFHGQARLARSFLARLRDAAAVLAQTSQQAELCRTGLGIEAQVIPNAHAVSEITVTPLNDRQGVLWVSRGDPIKRPDLMLDAWQHLPNQPRLRMIMPPSGRNADLSEAIAKRAAQMPTVDLVPGLPQAQVQSEFARARVFVLTSAGEGLPNVLIEALKHGTPVISVTVNPDHILATGTPNPCDPPAPGWCLGEDATPGDIAKAIQVLLTDDQLWSASSAAARDLALQRFDLAAVGDQYDKLLCHLLEKRTTSR